MKVRAAVREVSDAMLCYSPLLPVFRWRTSHQLAVLAYHDVSDPALFEEQIAYLRARANLVSLEDVLEAMRDSRSLPPASVLVTFDDADPSVYTAGLRILKKYQVPAVVFVIAGLVGTYTPFWWTEVETLVAAGATATPLPAGDPAGSLRMLKSVPDARRRELIDALRKSAGSVTVNTRQMGVPELKELMEAGISIGNHTVNHPCLVQCSPDEVATEIRHAHSMLAEMLGVPPRIFAYPNGDVHPASDHVLAELGYEAAFLFDHRLAGNPGSERFRVSRLRVNSTTSMNRFRLIVHGLHPALHNRRFNTADRQRLGAA